MADRDVLIRSLQPMWRKPARLVAGRQPAPVVAQAIKEALAKCLRDAGGLPGVVELAGLVEAVAIGEIGQVEAERRRREVERAMEGHPHTKITAREADRLIGELLVGKPLAEPALEALLERCLPALIEHHFFGRLRPKLVGERWPDLGAAWRWEEECIALLRPALGALVAQLADGRAVSQVRAPRLVLSPRRSTAELLDEPILM